jgi:hypothetical protein
MGVRLYATGQAHPKLGATSQLMSTEATPGDPKSGLEQMVPDETWGVKFPAALKSCILVLTSKRVFSSAQMTPPIMGNHPGGVAAGDLPAVTGLGVAPRGVWGGASADPRYLRTWYLQKMSDGHCMGRAAFAMVPPTG